MSSDLAKRPTEVQPDAEQEVDFARYGWAILHRWWLVVGAAIVGGVIGYLVSLGGGTLYQATATIYPGQPLTPSSGGQIQSLQTNPSTINQIVKSESVVVSVADALDINPSQLASGISTKAISGAVARTGQSQLIEITVRGPWRRQSARAANMLADTAVERVSTYPLAKVEQLSQLADAQQQELENLTGTIARYQQAIEDTALGSTERLIVTGLLTNAQSNRSQLTNLLAQTRLSLALARDVEAGRRLTAATASKVAAKGKQGSIIVGAVIGLVVGLLAALLWDPVRRRVRPAS